jgi:peptide/nickel transport system permease protein
VVTETVFNWPGMGKLIIDSITVLDRPVMVASSSWCSCSS